MTKIQIIATVGPATTGKIGQLVEAGVNGFRINSSHGSFDFHAKAVRSVRKITKEVFIVYDLKGPKIRLGDFRPVFLKAGMKIVLSTDFPKNREGVAVSSGRSSDIPVSFENLHKYVKKNHRLLIDDGLIGLKVAGVRGKRIFCEVLWGGVLRSRKGINHPDTVIDFPYTVSADIPRIKFAIENNVDYVADSFERSAADVDELRERLKGTGIKIISKIENPEGVENFDEILKKTDAVMIARGDLGVEMDVWEIPELQKKMIEKCNKAEKPVITATQMLESMIDDPRPKRSDVSDIANAVYDGTDAVMLSAETSIGNFPVLCVRVMRKIIEATLKTARYKRKKKKIVGLTHFFQ
ncbi:MAG: pyruvate kinase [Elusimicrobia bacterium]|nr:pyruvate kinase [Elusimicrobiota bacterium]